MSYAAHSEDHIHPPPSNWFFKYVWSLDHKTIGKQYLVDQRVLEVSG